MKRQNEMPDATGKAAEGAGCNISSESRRRRRFALTATFALATVFASSTPAAAAPAYRLGGLQCLDGQMRIAPPPYMDSSYHTDLRNPERVEWSPDLYRWYGSRRRWRRIISAPWYLAYTSDYGYFHFQFRGAWLAPSGNGTSFVPYSINRAGWYRIKQYLYWAKGSTDEDQRGILVSRWTRSCRYR